MSWKDKLLPGSFRNAPFLVESADGQSGRRVALHQYPLRDKPYAEDLGAEAGRFSLELFVVGPDYMDARDALIEAFNAPGPGLLVHPYRGERSVVALEVRGPRESTREGGMARFSVTFVESGEALFPKASADTAKAVEEKADAAADAVQEDFAETFDAEGGPDFIGDNARSLLQKASSKLDTIRQTITAVPLDVTEFVADVQSFTASIEGLIRAPMDLAAEVYGLVEDLVRLPDRIERSLTAYKVIGDILGGEPEVPRTTASRVRQADNQAALQALVKRSAVIGAARAAASLPLANPPSGAQYASYDAVAALRTELADQLDALMETASDPVYIALAELRTALVRDLTIRGADLARVVRHTPALTLPALVLAHQIYGDATREGEIVTRNRLRHPGFVTGGRDLEVLTDA